MINGSDVIYERLQVISYPVYHSEGFFVVWKDEKKAEKLYTIKEQNNSHSIYDGKDTLLADGISPKQVMEFIEADMNIGSPLPGSVVVSTGKSKIIKNEAGFAVGFEGGNVETSTQVMTAPVGAESETERIIRNAAAKQGFSDVDGLIKRFTRKPDLGTVKKKRVINVDTLDE